MKSITKIGLTILLVSLLAAACQKVELKREIPSSPRESYEPLPQ